MPNRPLVAPQVQPITFNPATAMQDVASISINRQKLQAARDASMARMRMQQLQAEYPDDPDAMITALSREFPAAGYELGENYSKYRKEQYQALSAKADSEVKGLEAATNMLIASGGPDNPEMYGLLRDAAVQKNPQLAQILVPVEQLTPERWQALQSTSKQGLDYLKAKAEGVKLFAEGQYQEGLGRVLAAAPNEETARTALKNAAADPRAKPFIGLYTSILDAAPDFQTAKRQMASATISPEKQADDARLKEAADEQKRQFGITSGISRGHLAVSQASEARQAKAGTAGGGTRPVTSGDANRLAEIDTSLDDVATLKKAMSTEGATGTSARIGAALPNIVTEFTGIGAEAKSKQAVIDRVKQVIGKALEGGVLRKEDEYKYTKILPTIGDPPSVVQTKLAGLKTAITQKKERQLESLEDAGYNTSAFRARTPAKDTGDIKQKDSLGIR